MEKHSKRIGLSVGIGIVLTVSSCAHSAQPKRGQPKPVAVQQAPPTPIETKRVELGGPSWNPGWDTLIERALPPTMLSSRVPQDVRRFCPRFFEMSATEKRAYWAYFFQALAAAEAGLDAKTNVPHPGAQPGRDHVTGQPIRCEGLLQLTYEDAQRYGCNFNWKVDRRLPLTDPHRTILQPKNNLACGIRILADQIIKQRKPLLERSSYWSTLRPGTLSYRVFAKQMTNPPDACGLHEHPTRHAVPEKKTGRSGERSEPVSEQ